VLSASNTPREMRRKLGEYFDAGVRLVWMVDPETQTVAVHTAANDFKLFERSETIDGGSVLPGFVLPLEDLFSELDRVKSQN
jgi:Uma2 family endonuclease